MIDQRLSIKTWWSEDVRKWFSEVYSGTDAARLGIPHIEITPNAKERLRRLATNRHMECVAKAIKTKSVARPLKPISAKNAEIIARIAEQELNDPDYALINDTPPKPKDVAFMEAVFELPDMWELRRKNTPQVIAEKDSNLKKECYKLIHLLKIDRQNIEFLFFRNSEPHSSHAAKTRYSELIETLDEIHRGIGKGFYHDATLTDFVPELPKKLEQKGANEVFAIRYLSDLANELFNRPLHRAVAEAITVSFDLKEEVSIERVKDLWRDRPKKGGD